MKHRNITFPILLALGFFTVALAVPAYSDSTHGSAIVGLWHAQYHGDFEGLQAFEQWHSDGLEFEAGGDAYGSFCVGTWEALGHRRVKQFHTWWSFDPATGQLDGYWRQNQTLTVSHDGRTYAGTVLAKDNDLSVPNHRTPCYFVALGVKDHLCRRESADARRVALLGAWRWTFRS